jgi:hypothetical protein
VRTRRAILASASGVALGAVLGRFAEAQEKNVIEQPWSLEGLAGTYTAPREQTRGPAVLIIAGSGPTDRDGNNPGGIRADTYRMLAHALAAGGLRSLRYDKRGIGGSQAKMTREEDLRFDHYVDDAAAAARDLVGRADVTGLVLAGHSEGGLVAIRAASRAPVKGLVLLASLGRPIGVTLREQLLAAPIPATARADALRILDQLIAGERVDNVPAPLAALFRPSVQPYLASVLPLDPAAELGKLKLPVLLVHAGRDLQIGEADFAALANARTDAIILRLPEANHILKKVAAERAANLAAYANPYLPLDPGLAPKLFEFIRAVAP